MAYSLSSGEVYEDELSFKIAESAQMKTGKRLDIEDLIFNEEAKFEYPVLPLRRPHRLREPEGKHPPTNIPADYPSPEDWQKPASEDLLRTTGIAGQQYAMTRQKPGQPNWPPMLEGSDRIPGGGGPRRSLESVPERVQSAAVKYRNKIYEGYIHMDAIEKAARAEGVSPDDVIDTLDQDFGGFTTSTGRYITRADAAKMAGVKYGESYEIREKQMRDQGATDAEINKFFFEEMVDERIKREKEILLDRRADPERVEEIKKRWKDLSPDKRSEVISDETPDPLRPGQQYAGMMDWLFKKPPPFDPESSGYDEVRARAAGMRRDKTGHMGSVSLTTAEERKKYDLPEYSYILLKGKQHETWDKAVEAEEARGFEVVKRGDRYFSIPKVITDVKAEPLADFPEAGEGYDFREAGMGYGTSFEKFMEGQVKTFGRYEGKGKNRQFVPWDMGPKMNLEKFMKQVVAKHSSVQDNPDLALDFARAAKAINRSTIASLGFDPNKLVIDRRTNTSSLAGAYSTSADLMYSNQSALVPPGTIVHESMHRGFEILRKDPEAKEILDKYGPKEELMVRNLMVYQAGDPERHDKTDLHMFGVALPVLMPEYKEDLAKLEEIAQRLIKERKPKGPR